MADKPHIMIVAGIFYEDIVGHLETGAVKAIEAAHASCEIFNVPGAFEIPAAIKMAELAEARNFDGYVALGCVIRGETSHYDYVCGESARALQDLAAGDGLAIGFGILTVENKDQALERAAVDRRNKGGEAAQSCLAMIALRQHLQGSTD
ncbi:MAG: 6,7-dimethyl-8-ribityllumazine synthase [Alphaproteobacteria bacterium]|nr:6,7-dimethyl-8-ribityllumazine synthase [Alphaproteobacteria bacterium]